MPVSSQKCLRSDGSPVAMKSAHLLLCAALPAVHSQGSLACYLNIARMRFDLFDFDAYPRL
jgi:hypothetical protein